MNKSARAIQFIFSCHLITLFACTPASNNPPTFPVSGVVTLKGAPVEGADVVFVPNSHGAQAAFGKTDANGTYNLRTFVEGDGAVEGSYKVKVSKFELPKSEADGKVFSSSEEEIEFYNPEDGDKVQISKSLIPKKFTDHSTSGLTHSVTSPKSTFDIKLD